MKNRLIIMLVMALLSACNTNYRPATVTTTVERPVTVTRFSAASGATVTTGGVERITTTQPYQSPAYKAAGAALFSRP